MDENTELGISLTTLEKMTAQKLSSVIASKLDTPEDINQISFEESGLTEEDAGFLVVELVKGAGEYDDNVQKAYQHWEDQYETSRSGSVLLEAFKFIYEHWAIISLPLVGLRKLGYLKIEENPTVKKLIEKLKKKKSGGEGEKDSNEK